MSNRIPVIMLLFGMVLYCMMIGPFTAYMHNKPIEEKLGYVPSVKILKPLSADQKELTAALIVFKVVMYFGSLMDNTSEGTIIDQQPDLSGMSRLLHNAVRLNPYHLDAYYFAQGFLTWDAHQFKVANDLLDYGMKYRNWDWMLPYFAGFNSAFFLKDYKKAAEYYKKAGKLSGMELHTMLAGRYMQESGQTDLAISYLMYLASVEKKSALKKTYQTRLTAFKEVKRIEMARARFKELRGVMPTSMEQLTVSGFLSPTPVDPYGGKFYFEPDGKVATTSKFAFAGVKKGLMAK